MVKSRSNSSQNPISAECVQIASNDKASDARENNWSHLQSDGWCSADFRSGHDHLWCGFWSARWWWIAFQPMIILSFRIWNPSSGERSLLSYLKTWDLPECISPQQTVEDTPKYFPHVVRFELKIAVNLLLTEEKHKTNFWLRTQIKHWGGCRSLWKPIAGGLVQSDYYCYYCHGWRNLLRKTADSLVEIQINFAHRLSKSIPNPISLSEIAWSSWQRTLLWTL